jgi:hypothetical protein
MLPAAVALALVASAAIAPGHRARAAADAASCPDPSAFAGLDSTAVITYGNGVLQPFDGTVTAGACSLSVNWAYFSSGQLSVFAWDPLALAPDPSTVALWTRHYDPSQLQRSHVATTFQDGLVVNAVEGVAERPRTSLALGYVCTDPWNPQYVNYWGSGPAALPVAHRFTVSGPVMSPLSGLHPVLGATFCPADTGTARERVLQSVVTATHAWPSPPFEFAQRLRVPVRGELHRVQLAFGLSPGGGLSPTGVIALYDATGQLSPPDVWGNALMRASFYQFIDYQPVWAGHYAFDQFATLEPGHDYWLIARVYNAVPLYTRPVTGSEGPDFSAGIGAMFVRDVIGGAWWQAAGEALSFQLIGRPDPSLLAVAPPAPRAFTVSVEPNPARGSALVRCSGARGPFRLEVLDVRGRRVGTTTVAEGGEWLWRGTRADGAPLPSGVYFVRAGDREGASSVTRVVLVR